MEVVGIFLSPLIQVAIDKLLSPELIKFARRKGITTAIQKLKTTLEDIKDVLADAEEKQITDKAVKNWLQQLHHLAYDVDDVLDEFATEALRRKLVMEEEPPEISTSKVLRRRLIPTCCISVVTPSTVAFNLAIGSKIREITSQLQHIATQRNRLGLVERVGGTGKKSPNVPQQRLPTTCLMNEPCIYGRDEDVKQIIGLLRKDAPTENKVDVIPIVGMGGIGKTTLAQLVYNDDTIKNHFNLQAWVCVSDDFDVKRISKAILESFTLQPCNLGELNEVQVKLNHTLAGKKFLIVLDDVWKHGYDEWNLLRSPFGAGAHGSKIIVTTREMNVASQMATVEHHHLQSLSYDNCWQIFSQHAFGIRNISEHSELESVGKKIVVRCRGLPLAARALGGLLCSKQKEHEWKEVLNSSIWNLPYEESGILPALKLSYHHLPCYLKRCFTYCAIIPKDYEFEEDELVLLWMAEGLIKHPEGGKLIEDLGHEYFHELVSRSFFQLSGGKKSHFMMHDLINDLAQAVAGEMCFRLEKNMEVGWQKKISEKVRHSSYIASKLEGMKQFEAFNNARGLRTFLRFLSPRVYSSHVTMFLFQDLLPKLERLRSLCLNNYSSVHELPESIGNLKHLRYVNVSNTGIRRLPESIVTLLNLEVLLLKFCRLENLPRHMGSLVNLRHFDLTGLLIPASMEMPLHIGKLTNLLTLSHFIVGNGSGQRIRELRNLSHLRGAISISRLENVSNVHDAREANLNSKQGLKDLSLEWDTVHSQETVEVQMGVLDMLRPYKLLERLTIKGYGSTTFPIWVGDSTFSKMVTMRLENCKCCKSLPPLGQLPSLEDLHIEGMSAIKRVGSEFYGQDCAESFPLLERLSFVDMPVWEDWSSNFGIDEGIQPYSHISELLIQNCPKLVGRLPNDLPCLKSLSIKNCSQLMVNISSVVLSSLTSLSMWDVPIPSLSAFLEMRNVVEMSSLELDIGNVSIPGSFCDPSVTDTVSVLHENVMLKHLTSITSLSIENPGNLTFLPSWFTRGLMGLKELKISSAKELMKLWENEVRLQHCLPSLRRLQITRCPQLVCLFEDEEGRGGRGGRGGIHQQKNELLPGMIRLEHLEIYDCEILKKLPQGLHFLTSLREVRISECPSLVYFPKKGLPSLLRRLEIKYCNALQSLPELMTLNNLEQLWIIDCASLAFISTKGGLPPTLKDFRIAGCKKLESLLAEGMKVNCPSLETIIITECDCLKSLPDPLNSNCNKLSRLSIDGCTNFESLPEGWFKPKTILRELLIRNCEKLEALPLYANEENSNKKNNNQLASFEKLLLYKCPEGIVSYFLKEGGFPTNLRSLSIGDIKVGAQQLLSPSEWGLHRLSSLTTLELEGPIPGMVSFPGHGMLLPTSLSHLHIRNFPILERLSSKEFQTLASLETLYIANCPRFCLFPKEGLPPSLLHLELCNCAELAHFPEQGLPRSLLQLRILQCPLLEQRCKIRKGQYWPLIANVPDALIIG